MHYNYLLSYIIFANYCSVKAKFKNQKGLTLLELMIVLAIIGILAAIAVPSFMSYREKAQYAATIAEIRQISTKVNEFFITTDRYPVNLAEVGLGNLSDPWGTPYQYLDVSIIVSKGPKRKNRATNPVNTDFDLYSMGPDGKSQLAFTAPVSFDDIVRANNGAFLGRVSDY